MRFSLPTPTTTASGCGMAPPQSDVPAPRGITLTPSRCRKRMTSDTSSVERGSTTASGICR